MPFEQISIKSDDLHVFVDLSRSSRLLLFRLYAHSTMQFMRSTFHGDLTPFEKCFKRLVKNGISPVEYLTSKEFKVFKFLLNIGSWTPINSLVHIPNIMLD